MYWEIEQYKNKALEIGKVKPLKLEAFKTGKKSMEAKFFGYWENKRW